MHGTMSLKFRCHLLFDCTSYRLNMFRALLCPSSGARDYNVDYHIGRIRSRFAVGWRLGTVRLQPGHYSSLPAPNIQHTANRERDDQRGNQHYIRELLMMGIVVPETC